MRAHNKSLSVLVLDSGGRGCVTNGDLLPCPMQVAMVRYPSAGHAFLTRSFPILGMSDKTYSNDYDAVFFLFFLTGF